jgi:rhomboid family GlyGly-CTERM serine protease
MGVLRPVTRLRERLESLNCDGPYGRALLLVCLALLMLALTGEGGRLALRYERAALAAGQLWRLATAHLVHLGLRHALVNVLGLVLLWILFARDYSPRQWLLIMLAAVLAIDAGLWLLDSTVRWYVGSSGVLHGVLAAGALAWVRRGQKEGWLLVMLLAGKLAYEHWAGPLPFSGDIAVVTSAHLFGVVGGALAALVVWPRPL